MSKRDDEEFSDVIDSSDGHVMADGNEADDEGDLDENDDQKTESKRDSSKQNEDVAMGNQQQNRKRRHQAEVDTKDACEGASKRKKSMATVDQDKMRYWVEVFSKSGNLKSTVSGFTASRTEGIAYHLRNSSKGNVKIRLLRKPCKTLTKKTVGPNSVFSDTVIVSGGEMKKLVRVTALDNSITISIEDTKVETITLGDDNEDDNASRQEKNDEDGADDDKDQ